MTAPDLPWVNPVGGLGDTLMLAGVLKQVVERDPARRFNLVVRTKYPPLLAGHPALVHIGHPPPGATILPTDYWHHESFGPPDARAFQILARMFGLAAPVEERLFVPFPLEEDPILAARLPWRRRNVLLCPTSDSPRKQMAFERWDALVARLRRDDAFVVQLGRAGDPYVRGAYSLIGLTTPRQAIALMRRFDLVLTADSFLMHAAHLCGVPAVVLWGPTDHRVYGYAGQVHLQAPPCRDAADCIAPGNTAAYGTVCPKGAAHCVDQLDPGAVYEQARAALAGGIAP
ncbi:MAG TPA: glycosyltransferase family 9 protein [Polyangia bacterium]